MSQVVANGKPVIEMRLCMPRVGAWVSDLYIDAEDSLSGDITVTIAGGSSDLELVGTVRQGGAYLKANQIRVIAGKNGMDGLASPRAYQNGALLRTVLSDLASDAGETIDASSSQSALGSSLGRWTTTLTTISEVFAHAINLGSPGSIHRFLPNGNLFIGDDGLEEYAEEFQILNEQPQRLTASIGLYAPTLLPGMAIDGRRVDYVEHTIRSASSQTMVWFDQ